MHFLRYPLGETGLKHPAFHFERLTRRRIKFGKAFNGFESKKTIAGSTILLQVVGFKDMTKSSLLHTCCSGLLFYSIVVFHCLPGI